MSRLCAIVLILTGFQSVRAADKPLTVVYDVVDLIQQPGGRTGYKRIDEIARLIVSSIHEGGWGGETEGASRLRELNGTKLEIQTTAKYHKEIADLLAALRRIKDMCVNLNADLYEIDRAVFEKEIKPLLNRRAVVEAEGANVEVLKKGKLVVTNALSIADGTEARPLAVRQAFTFIEKAEVGAKGQINEYGLGFQGVTFRVTPTVSADRRFVSLKITHKVTELIELKKRRVFAPKSEEQVTIELPKLSETTTTTTIEVGDGAWAVAVVGYRSPAAKAKDRVLVLALRPTIYIGEEDKERRNNPK